MGRPSIGLALGGGGARGMAHIGVLKVFEEQNIPIDFIAGTSIGALVGAGYALDPNGKHLYERIAKFLVSPEFEKSGLSRFRRKEAAENFFGQVATFVKERIVINLAHSRSSIVGGDRLRGVVDFVLPDKKIEDTQIPLTVVATDLVSGQSVDFTRGDMRRAVLASASIPGFLPPVLYNGRLLVDGAVTAPIPVLAARAMGADIVIGVDVGQDVTVQDDNDNIVDIMFRTNSITAFSLRRLLVDRADMIINPAVGEVHWADFAQYETLVQRGERAATRMLPQIKAMLQSRRSLWRRIVGFAGQRA